MRRLVLSAILAWVGLSSTAPGAVHGFAQPKATAEALGHHRDEWRFPGEYESHQAMWMLWPTYENKAGFPSTDVVSDLIHAMRGRTHVNLAVQDDGDEAAARTLLTDRGVPLDHVRFFHLEHLDLWARDMGPQFTRSRAGRLRVTDWNFNYWGYEDPDSPNSTAEESFDRRAAASIDVPIVDAAAGPVTGARFVHEGGSASHNGQGTMIAVESVVMQRNLGPNRFCGGDAPVTDFSQPNTYAPNRHWPACRALVEREYGRLLGVKKIIWIPTGVIEDGGTFRGAMAPHLRVPELDGIAIPHAGVYTMYGTNGHADEFIRFVGPDAVVLAQARVPKALPRTAAEGLLLWLELRNHERLDRAYAVISRATTASGQPIRVVRMPTAPLTFDVTGPGDGLYDYFAAYTGWEDGASTPPRMLGLWASSYVNYVPTNDLVIVSKFWKPGRALEIKRRDAEAVEALKKVFPGRDIVQVYSENVNRGGGGLNCITQQQPASARFAKKCGWAKVKVDVEVAPLYSQPSGGPTSGAVPRLTRSGDDIYLERLSETENRVEVRVVGRLRFDGAVGWVDRDDIESAGERCPAVYSRN